MCVLEFLFCFSIKCCLLIVTRCVDGVFSTCQEGFVSDCVCVWRDFVCLILLEMYPVSQFAVRDRLFSVFG